MLRNIHSTLEKIAKALGVDLSGLFELDKEEVKAYDQSLMEKLRLMEKLSEEEKKTVFSIVDAFVSRKKLKQSLEHLLHEAV
jgi:transcriptional regulator with XRE-family HTH domain